MNIYLSVRKWSNMHSTHFTLLIVQNEMCDKNCT